LLRDLQQPEYLHVLLNHVPITGLAVAVLGLAIALISRGRRAIVCALTMIAVCSAAAWPVYLTGKASYRTIRKVADDRGTDWLDEHMERADSWTIVYAGVFLFAVAGVLVPIRWKKLQVPFAIATLAVAIGGLAAGAYIAEAGGKVRHPEFRGEEKGSQSSGS
jgi:hypothetical protein